MHALNNCTVKRNSVSNKHVLSYQQNIYIPWNIFLTYTFAFQNSRMHISSAGFSLEPKLKVKLFYHDGYIQTFGMIYRVFNIVAL